MEIKVGQTVKLVAKTKHGRERLKRDGNIFVINRIMNSVPCLNSAGIMITPPNGNSRWVAIPVDKDFEVLI